MPMTSHEPSCRARLPSANTTALNGASSKSERKSTAAGPHEQRWGDERH